MQKKKILLLVFLLSGSLIQSQIPQGQIKGPFLFRSNIYPGTERNYWLYIPAQYDAAKPACVMVVQDGISRATGWKLPSTLDTLINNKEVPVIIGIFVDHGKLPAKDTADYPRFNRSFEYDALGDRYANFLIKELLPEVSRSYNLSKDPNDRSITGASSGAICAFNVAWERPDVFRRVLSTIGTYVGLRGGDEFATLVRKTEPKPLRIFLEDGTSDLNIYAGDWWMANQDMLSSLTWAGYEVNHAWGEGGHDNKHTLLIIRDALKWLWKDYPSPVQMHANNYGGLKLVVNNEGWKEIQLNGIKAVKLAGNNEGEIFFTSEQQKSIYKINRESSVTQFAKLKVQTDGISFYSDGNLYTGDITNHKIISINKNGMIKDIAAGITAEFICCSNLGVYFTEPAKDRIGFYNFSKKTLQYWPVKEKPQGLSFNPGQSFLDVGVANGVLGYSFKIMNDGSLEYGQPYIHYHIPYGEMTASVKGMAVDTSGFIYSATSMGVQVSDQLGRVNFIFSNPGSNITDVKIGGAEFNTMYVICDGKIFFRKINSKAALPWQKIKPPAPRL